MCSCFPPSKANPGRSDVASWLSTSLLLLLILPSPCCLPAAALSEHVTVEGIYIKDSGHPFAGAALMTKGEYYRISDDSAAQTYTLHDRTKLKLNYHRLQAGGFSNPLKRAQGKTKKLQNPPEGCIGLVPFPHLCSNHFSPQGEGLRPRWRQSLEQYRLKNELFPRPVRGPRLQKK
jgi:hypothetical protein